MGVGEDTDVVGLFAVVAWLEDGGRDGVGWS